MCREIWWYLAFHTSHQLEFFGGAKLFVMCQIFMGGRLAPFAFVELFHSISMRMTASPASCAPPSRKRRFCSHACTSLHACRLFTPFTASLCVTKPMAEPLLPAAPCQTAWFRRSFRNPAGRPCLRFFLGRPPKSEGCSCLPKAQLLGAPLACLKTTSFLGAAAPHASRGVG